jgi:hypothetical protein
MSIKELIIKKLQDYDNEKINSLEKENLLSNFYEDLLDSEIKFNSHIKPIIKNLYYFNNREYYRKNVKQWVIDDTYHLKINSIGFTKASIEFISNKTNEYKILNLTILSKNINKTIENGEYNKIFDEDEMFDICNLLISKKYLDICKIVEKKN